MYQVVAADTRQVHFCILPQAPFLITSFGSWQPCTSHQELFTVELPKLAEDRARHAGQDLMCCFRKWKSGQGPYTDFDFLENAAFFCHPWIMLSCDESGEWYIAIAYTVLQITGDLASGSDASQASIQSRQESEGQLCSEVTCLHLLSQISFGVQDYLPDLVVRKGIVCWTIPTLLFLHWTGWFRGIKCIF